MQINLFKLDIKNYWRNIDKKILLSFILLFSLGLFFSFSSTSSLAGERLNKDYYYFFSKHFIFFIASIFLMFFISFLDLKLVDKLIFPLFIFFIILLILVAIVGIEVKGSKRWLNLYFLRVQPVEFIKPIFVLTLAQILTMKKFKNINITYAVSFLILTCLLILLINQPDVGQSVLLFCTWASIVFISGIALSYIILLIISFFSLITGLLFIFPDRFGYVILRLKNFFDPNISGGFQSQKALEAIKQGGIKGQGIGEGILKESVPEAHTDYIIAVISEEFGSIISIFLISIFLYLSFQILKKTIIQKKEVIKISLIGLSTLLIFQTFIHIGVNTSLLPTTGMTLPFISYGGSSLIGSAILAGLVLNFTKRRFDD